jgi:hypothetical protein
VIEAKNVFFVVVYKIEKGEHLLVCQDIQEIVKVWNTAHAMTLVG